MGNGVKIGVVYIILVYILRSWLIHVGCGSVRNGTQFVWQG